jgi:ABC-type branched-subunit amino acid transport system substrate-binding protein
MLLAACGGGAQQVAQQSAPTVADRQSVQAAPTAPGAVAQAPAAVKHPSASLPIAAKSKTHTEVAKAPAATKVASVGGSAAAKARSASTTDGQTADQKMYEQKNGATDIGVTKDAIQLGSVSMHGMALGNVLITPQVAGIRAAISAINDRGGVAGRRLNLADCDDGPGEVSRTKACVKKLATQDRIFSLLTVTSWGSASIHDDLSQYQLPLVGAWAYSQTEWQDPYMFPTHMSMIHEAIAGGNWVRDTIKPKTYGLLCLTSPEMQLACSQVQKVLDAAGSKLVKKVDVAISETSMAPAILAMRAADPEHIVNYTVNPSTIAKFMVEAAQQGYYPPKGMSGNHVAAEVLGSLFGKWPVDRYWTNTTYKLWGPEFISTMNKYARGSRGTFHHIVQAGYTGVNIFAAAAKDVGPNLTRERLMATLSNGNVWKADASLDQKFAYTPAERGDNWSPNMGQGREFMYKYTSTNTTANPDGSPSGFAPDDGQFVIGTNH